VKEFTERLPDVIKAVQSLRSSGLSVSLPYQTANGQMCFQVEDCILTAAQILELFDNNNLDREGIHQFEAERRRTQEARRVSRS
jgi:hypothetical protein